MVLTVRKILRWGNGEESDSLYGESALARNVCAKKITPELRSKLKEQSPHLPDRINDKGSIPQAGIRWSMPETEGRHI